MMMMMMTMMMMMMMIDDDGGGGANGRDEKEANGCLPSPSLCAQKQTRAAQMESGF